MNAAMSPADVLEGAAAEIERDGLAKGGYGIRRGEACCSLGAIIRQYQGSMSIHHVETRPEVTALAKAVTGRQFIDPACEVADWNDAPERTAEEVTATMRRVAADLRAEASA